MFQISARFLQIFIKLSIIRAAQRKYNFFVFILASQFSVSKQHSFTFYGKTFITKIKINSNYKYKSCSNAHTAIIRPVAKSSWKTAVLLYMYTHLMSKIRNLFGFTKICQIYLVDLMIILQFKDKFIWSCTWFQTDQFDASNAQPVEVMRNHFTFVILLIKCEVTDSQSNYFQIEAMPKYQQFQLCVL